MKKQRKRKSRARWQTERALVRMMKIDWLYIAVCGMVVGAVVTIVMMLIVSITVNTDPGTTITEEYVEIGERWRQPEDWPEEYLPGLTAPEPPRLRTEEEIIQDYLE